MRIVSPRPRHLALLGPTATGKSGLAVELARRRSGIELVSVDSMQVYRGMDVGTAKPTAAEQVDVPHHLIDIADPGERFTVSRFAAAAEVALAGIEARGHTAVLVGGTGLYLRAVLEDLTPPGEYPDVRAELENWLAGDGLAGDGIDTDGIDTDGIDTDGIDRGSGSACSGGPPIRSGVESSRVGVLYRRLAELDPAAAGRIEPGNTRRIVRALEVTVGSGRRFSDWGPGMAVYENRAHLAIVGVWLPRTVVADRIARRVDAMIAAGLVDEVRALVARPGGLGPTARQALGYKELLGHVEDGRALGECVEETVRRTRQFSHRQRRWFRRDPRIRWHGTRADPRLLLPGLDVELARCGPP